MFANIKNIKYKKKQQYHEKQTGAESFLGLALVKFRFIQFVSSGGRQWNEQNCWGVQSFCTLQKLDQTKCCKRIQIRTQQVDESDQRSARWAGQSHQLDLERRFLTTCIFFIYSCSALYNLFNFVYTLSVNRK